MRIALAERFQRDVRALTTTQRGAVFEVLLSLLRAIGDPTCTPESGFGSSTEAASGKPDWGWGSGSSSPSSPTC